MSAGELDARAVRGTVTVTGAGGSGPQMVIPYAFAVSRGVRRNDIALAAKGAKATSDSELDREPGCTARAIDGDVEGTGDFGGKRWHSALTPHPHWIAVELGQPRAIAQVIVHFADPQGRPADFDGQASDDGQTWKTLFEERDCQEKERYAKDIGGVTLRHFRLMILRSASAQWPNAAQVSEVELIGAAGNP